MKPLRQVERWTGRREPVSVSVAKGLILGAVLIALAALAGCAEYPVTLSIKGRFGTYAFTPAPVAIPILKAK